jgi:C-terminal processing protease CtpA/Prc
MSGIEVVYNGKMLVQERESSLAESYERSANFGSGGNTVNIVTNYGYKFKPSYRVNEVLKGSPADLAGVIKVDVLMRINGKPVYNYNLEEIIGKFQQKANKKIRLTIMRNGQLITLEFKLKRIV